MKASQLVLNLDADPAWDETHFFVSASNADAFRSIQAWPQWPSPVLIVTGPPRCGKSHLVAIWRARSGAIPLDLLAATGTPLPASSASVSIEDIDAKPFDELLLFHRLNAAKEYGGFVLLTARTAPGQWRVTLPDLRSRLRSYPVAAVQVPDDELLSAVLVKHFADRQLAVTPDVIPYLMLRMERSMAAAQELVSKIDALALSTQRRVTKAVAAEVLRQLDPERLDVEIS